MYKEKMVSAIIAAYNEADTIGQVIDVILSHPDIGEVIVVDDGSSDATSEIARDKGAVVITLEKNGGKANAMDAGVKKAEGEVIFFSDADIFDLDHKKISQIIDPIREGKFAMNVGIRTRRLFFYNYLFPYFPIIGGERALQKELWFQVPEEGKENFKIEIALNFTAKQTEKGMGFAVIPGISQRIKEKKQGLTRGLWNRAKMIGDILSISYQLYIARSIKNIFGKKVSVK